VDSCDTFLWNKRSLWRSFWLRPRVIFKSINQPKNPAMEDATTAPVIFKKSAKSRTAVRKKTGSEWSEDKDEQSVSAPEVVQHENGADERHSHPIGSIQQKVESMEVDEEGLDESVIRDSVAKKKDKIEDGLQRKLTKREADERHKDKEKAGFKSKDKKSLLSFEEEEVLTESFPFRFFS